MIPPSRYWLLLFHYGASHQLAADTLPCWLPLLHALTLIRHYDIAVMILRLLPPAMLSYYAAAIITPYADAADFLLIFARHWLDALPLFSLFCRFHCHYAFRCWWWCHAAMATPLLIFITLRYHKRLPCVTMLLPCWYADAAFHIIVTLHIIAFITRVTPDATAPASVRHASLSPFDTLIAYAASAITLTAILPPLRITLPPPLMPYWYIFRYAAAAMLIIITLSIFSPLLLLSHMILFRSFFCFIDISIFFH